MKYVQDNVSGGPDNEELIICHFVSGREMSARFYEFDPEILQSCSMILCQNWHVPYVFIISPEIGVPADPILPNTPGTLQPIQNKILARSQRIRFQNSRV